MPAQLCLGTVQFGMPYGVTNIHGKVAESEVRSILNLADKAGIKWLDTAQAYGSAEEVVGRCSSTSSGYRFISKLPAHVPPNKWEENLKKSLQRLSTDKLDGFLVHSSKDLRSSYGDRLLDWLEGTKERGLVERIGVSIYDAYELNGLPLDRLQIVQLPLSLYDQRLVRDGTVSELESMGISVHARSLFLQGLVLQSSTIWPDFLSPAFRAHHQNFQNYLENQGFSLLEGALAFARSCQALEASLIGVLTVSELQAILAAWSSCLSLNISELHMWNWDDPADLDPRFWPSR